MEVFWSGFFGALAGGAAVLLGAWISGRFAIRAAREAAQANLEAAKEQEIRRQQVVAILGIISHRGAMGPNPDSETLRNLLLYMNMMSAVFSGSAEVQSHIKSYFGNRSNANFISLVRSAAKVAGLDVTGLSNDDIESIFS